IRKGRSPRDMLIFVSNFTPEAHENYRIGIPLDAAYTEIFNTDHEKYGGSHVLNTGPIAAQQMPWHNRPFSITLRVPPLGTLILRPENIKEEDS
ncbi:MAG TPA: 1,4-alpha-glucan branching enzyme, partial [Ruminiclostridium sp.]|nr:1,4-alpha-glucan branching enzyme [Ruminiclostridium sp.]